MVTRKYFHLEAMIDASVFHDVLGLIENRSRILRMGVAKTGGEDAETGAPRAVPSGREFMMMFMQKNSRFKIRDAIAAAAELGLAKSIVYTACNVLVNEGAIKRVGPATYQLASKTKMAKAAMVKQGQPKHTPTGGAGKKRPPGQTVPDRIIAFLKSKQNGSGEGVPLADIKKAIGGTGVSPTLASLLKRKLVTRPAPSHYRAS